MSVLPNESVINRINNRKKIAYELLCSWQIYTYHMMMWR